MSTTIAMMQPYLFPYLGYFQLIAATDVFVLGDDLQYIKSGWVNRNNILFNNEAKLLTFPMKKDRFELAINQRQLSENFAVEAQRLINLIASSYAKAPCFRQAMPVIESVIRCPERNLALYIEHSIRQLCAYLNISTPVYRASDAKIIAADKQDRVVQTARLFGASLYINPIGGTALYEQSYFARHGLGLKFIKMDEVAYRQFRTPFVGNLSIIDVMMFNTVDEIRALLPRYSLHDGDTPQRPAMPADLRTPADAEMM
ncbi:WbqC family protein [Pseudomonas putida]